MDSKHYILFIFHHDFNLFLTCKSYAFVIYYSVPLSVEILNTHEEIEVSCIDIIYVRAIDNADIKLI